jgi:hypothetical protein
MEILSIEEHSPGRQTALLVKVPAIIGRTTLLLWLLAAVVLGLCLYVGPAIAVGIVLLGPCLLMDNDVLP